MLSTTGLAAIPIIELDKQWNKIANEREGLQASMENRRYQLDTTEKKLREMSNRKFTSEQYLETTKNHLSHLKNSLARLQSQQGDTIAFIGHIKKIYSFLAAFNSKVNGIYTHQKMKTLLKPLLDSVDDLVEFLRHSKSEELVSLIGDKKVVERIRQYTHSV